jgi:hypothetical protein
LIVRRTVRKPVSEANKNEWFSQLEDIEFVFPKEYNKILSPVFKQDFDFDLRDDNGVLTFTLTPAPKPPETNVSECKKPSKQRMKLYQSPKIPQVKLGCVK